MLTRILFGLEQIRRRNLEQKSIRRCIICKFAVMLDIQVAIRSNEQGIMGSPKTDHKCAILH